MLPNCELIYQIYVLFSLLCLFYLVFENCWQHDTTDNQYLRLCVLDRQGYSKFNSLLLDTVG
ncbi:MAG: hypothetical protein WBA89_22910 [Microcoleus sp.]|uniref:hypothetical protein n=1 Tax=Microcoleus sp. TaxID=44472 RepID=UPI003C749743